jgi:hypothetical protein
MTVQFDLSTLIREMPKFELVLYPPGRGDGAVVRR